MENGKLEKKVGVGERSINSWYHSVFTLNTRVKTHGITVYSQGIQKYKLMKFKLMKYKLMKYKLMVEKYKLMYNSVFTFGAAKLKENINPLEALSEKETVKPI
ncbi:hypothetical protein OUZ56_010326 [Daphnia magna]|uniref:Uncharacterized protein n=1 Tax=Daphnia magna TaxID=35525 RepID=A0ABR0AI77_9CRUS|nr:hypothetical protein OUZ56_010326 [Daphnia magna]